MPTQARVTLVLDRLQCNSTEDNAGKDECYMKINGTGISSNQNRLPGDGHHSLNDGQTWTLNEKIFSKRIIEEDEPLSVEIELWDEDAGLWGLDKDDFLGRIQMTIGVNTSSEKSSWKFDRDGADYDLFWELTVQKREVPEW